MFLFAGNRTTNAIAFRRAASE